MSLGIPSIGPREYLPLLVNEGFGLEPDNVLLSFFIGNDFGEESRRRKYLDYSYVASLITYVLERWTIFERPIGIAFGTYDDNASTFTDDAYLRLELTRHHFCAQQ
jgi:hypothetical protein